MDRGEDGSSICSLPSFLRFVELAGQDWPLFSAPHLRTFCGRYGPIAGYAGCGRSHPRGCSRIIYERLVDILDLDVRVGDDDALGLCSTASASLRNSASVRLRSEMSLAMPSTPISLLLASKIGVLIVSGSRCSRHPHTPRPLR